MDGRKVNPNSLEGKTVKELRSIVKERGIKGYSSLLKASLIELLRSKFEKPNLKHSTSKVKKSPAKKSPAKKSVTKNKKVSAKKGTLKAYRIGVSGKNIVLSGFRSSLLKADLESKGAVIKTSITKTTDLVIVKDVDSESQKISAAQLAGIRIESMDTFIFA